MPNWLKAERLARSAPLSGQSHWHRRAGLTGLASLGPRGSTAAGLPARADFLVIGGGLAGLSVASELAAAEPSASVVLLERAVLGFGASGRNAGLLAPLPAPVWLLGADTNAERAWALAHINSEVHALAGRLAALEPGCDLAPAKLRLEAQGIFTSAGLRRVGDTLARCGIAFEAGAGPRGALAIDIPTHTLDPYRTVLAVAAQARTRGVIIHEGVGVIRVAESSAGVEVAVDGGGGITAGRVVLATNGYTDSVALPGKVAAKPVWNFAVAAPFPAGTIPDAETARRFVVELNLSYVYYRADGGRTVYGGIERFSPPVGGEFAVPQDILARLEDLLDKTFPAAQLTPTEAWSGCYHQTKTDLPLLGRLGARGHIIVNAGYGGTGVALSMICARLACAMARDDRFATQEDRRLFDAIKATRLPVAGLVGLVTGVAGDLARGRSGLPGA